MKGALRAGSCPVAPVRSRDRARAPVESQALGTERRRRRKLPSGRERALAQAGVPDKQSPGLDPRSDVAGVSGHTAASARASDRRVISLEALRTQLPVVKLRHQVVNWLRLQPAFG